MGSDVPLSTAVILFNPPGTHKVHRQVCEQCCSRHSQSTHLTFYLPTYLSLKSRCHFLFLILFPAFFSPLVFLCDPESAGQRSTLASLRYGSEPVNSGRELWPGVKLCSSHSQCLCLPIKRNVFMLYGIMDKEAL